MGFAFINTYLGVEVSLPSLSTWSTSCHIRDVYCKITTIIIIMNSANED